MRNHENKNGARKSVGATKPGIGARIVNGLKSFVDVLEKGEPVTEKFTCRKIVLDLTPVAHDARSVKAIRRRLNVSQSVFSQLLGVKASTIQSWEQGRQAPSEMACRFLDEIRRDPSYWKARIAKAVREKAVERH